MVTKQKFVRIHGENIGRSPRKQYVAASGPAWDETGEMLMKPDNPAFAIDFSAGR